MSIFRKLFGKTTPVEDSRPDQPDPSGGSPSGEVVQVWDQFGRLMQMPKDTWRVQVLLPNLARSRNDPEALQALIAAALGDGYAADVLELTQHLTTIDPQPPRAANLLGAVLHQLGKHAEAKSVLEKAICDHG